jgi:hypothetical protein
MIFIGNGCFKEGMIAYLRRVSPVYWELIPHQNSLADYVRASKNPYINTADKVYGKFIDDIAAEFSFYTLERWANTPVDNLPIMLKVDRRNQAWYCVLLIGGPRALLYSPTRPEEIINDNNRRTFLKHLHQMMLRGVEPSQ